MAQLATPNHFTQEARRIRARVPAVLSKWGLPPKFTRWRLTQDPDTGLAVLFAVLNSKYITAHTSIPFSDYFDPRLLNDLANELGVQVVFCNYDGLRYAFILDRGSLDKLPTHIDFPILDGDRLLVGVIYKDEPAPGWIISQEPTPLVDAAPVDDHALVHQGVGAFLKVFDDIKRRDDAVLKRSDQDPPDVMIIDEEDFNRRMAEKETNQERIKHIRKLFDEMPE